MLYQPKTNLAFHIDSIMNRHLISIFDNERFFSYECAEWNYDNVDMYTNEMNNHIDDIDTFNTFFTSFSSKNKLKILKSNEVYVFNNSIHNFFNGSDKLRVNFVFETNDMIIHNEDARAKLI